ncbi:hypothetical protein F441_14648, partial [Phytophthora nicotianae CJ01A1]
MPQKLPWLEVTVGVSISDGKEFLETLKVYKLTRSQPTACSICTNPLLHQMRYGLLECISTTCTDYAPTIKCPWRGKILTCERSNIMAVYELNEHFSNVVEPRKKVMPPPQKEFCKEMAEQGLKPGHIRNAMKIKMQLSEDTAPTLKMVQNLVNYYSRTKLGNNDRHDKITQLVRDAAFTGRGEHAQAFMFGWDLDVDGKPVVGNGSDNNPFLVGITSKTLLVRLGRDPGTYILHVDATFKLNQVSYPVLVL